MITKLRTAVPGDENVLAELNALVHEFHVKHYPSYFKPGDLGLITAWFRDMIRKPTVQIWVAERSGQAVGYAVIILRERPEEALSYVRKWLEIDQIGVLPEHQRTGIGRRLIQRTLRSARKQKIRDVELTSWSFNGKAHKAFKRLGFSPRIVRFGVEV